MGSTSRDCPRTKGSAPASSWCRRAAGSFPSLSLEENLRIGTTPRRAGTWNLDKVFELFPWMAERRDRPVVYLSGGEQQAVAIGRALMANPRILLIDEMSLGLSPAVVRRLYDLLPELLAAGMTILLVEQDVTQALRVSDRAHCLLEGRITLSGRPRDLAPADVEAAYFGLANERHDRPRLGASMAWVNAIVQGILLGGLYALFACGLSLMFGVMRVVNLAHGDFAVLAAYLALAVITGLHVPVLWSALVVAPLFGVVGYLVQRFIIQRSLDVSPLTTLLVTFGLSIVIQNALLEGLSANSQSLPSGSLASASFQVNSQLSIGYESVIVFAVAVVVLVGLQVFLSRARLGRQVRAAADDQEAASIVGVNVRHVYGVAAAIAFATVALAGVAFGMYSSFDPAAGPQRLIFAFEAVVIGGVGSLWGTLAGGIILGVAQVLGSQVDASFGVLAGHLVFLVVLAVRPSGLIAARLS